MIPKKEKLEKGNKRCIQKSIKIEKSLYKEYQNLAYEDLESADKEENPRWAVTKAYQSLLDDKETLFQEISNIRINRNKYLYLPKTLRNVKTPSNQIIKEVKQIIKILGEIE